jgi:hypothetical protein
LANAQRQALGFHAVLDGQDTLFEQLALRAVGQLGGGVWDGTRLLRESEIWITRLVGRLHGRVAGKGGGDTKLLLLPVDVGDRVAWRRFDQSAQPDAWPKNEPRIAWLVSSCARSIHRQHRAVSAIPPDGQIVETQAGQAAA